MSDSDPRTIVDPTTGRPILMAPKRQNRPMHTGSKPVDKRCPFCSGNEADTPPEVIGIRENPTGNDTPGWRVRGFDNLYPATPHHEVIAEGGAHTEHPSDLDEHLWSDIVRVWQRRIEALEELPDVSNAYLFKNVGARAGASIAHNHSQLIGLDTIPPRVELELAQQRAHGRCLMCESLRTAEDELRAIVATEDYVAFAPDPPKLPYESWLAPRDCQSDFVTADPHALGAALYRWLMALGRALDRPPCNLWLHRLPRNLWPKGEMFHWHFELQPRTGQLAGLELGGDMYINSVPATTTAALFRAAIPDLP